MSVLFEVSFVVDTKRFGEVLAALEGKVFNVKHRLVRREVESIAPTQDAVMKASVALLRPMNNHDRAKAFIEKLRKEGVKTIKTRQMADMLSTGPNNASTIMSDLVKNKLLKRASIGTYTIVEA